MARQKIKRLPKENTILRILSILMMTFMMLSQPAWSGVTKEELMKEEGFSKATPEDRLKWLNSQIQAKKYKQHTVKGIITELYTDVLDTVGDPVGSLVSYDVLKKKYRKLPGLPSAFINKLYLSALKNEVDATARLVKYADIRLKHKKIPSLSGSVLSRLYWEALQTESTALDKLKKYGKLNTSHKKLSSVSDVGRALITRYLATDPAAIKADLKGKIKLVKSLQDDKLVSWTTTSSIYTGMLSYHLATNPEYQAADSMGKLKYLKQLEAIDGVVGSLTTTSFAKGIAVEYIASLPDAERAAAIKEITPVLDTFSKSTVRDAFPK